MKDNTWEFVKKSLNLIKKQYDRLDKTLEGLMIAPESPLVDVYGRIEERLIDALELLVDDEFNTIHWFVYECDFGRNPMKAEVNWKTIKIDSYDKLRQILEGE